MPLKTAKKAADRTVNLFKWARRPVERRIDKQPVMVRYTFGGITVLLGIVNLVNPFIPGVFLIIAGVGVIHRTRNEVSAKFKTFAFLVKEKTKDKLMDFANGAQHKKVELTEAFHINSRHFADKLTRLLSEKTKLKLRHRK